MRFSPQHWAQIIAFLAGQCRFPFLRLQRMHFILGVQKGLSYSATEPQTNTFTGFWERIGAGKTCRITRIFLLTGIYAKEIAPSEAGSSRSEERRVGKEGRYRSWRSQ